MLLTTFRFEVRLIASPTVVAGRQRLPGTGDGYSEPSGAQVLGDGLFQEVSGLDIEMDVQEYVEGGRNNGIVRRVGRAKYQPLVLKRGMFYPMGNDNDSEGAKAAIDLWQWMQGIADGVRPVRRYDGVIHVMSADNTVRASWVFDRGLPSKIKGPDLNAKTGEIAIEELTIAHEGLRLLPPGGGA
jgi:phage tail-like protein